MGEKKQSGFGFVSKDILLDPEIPVEAKALYAYLCAHADKEGICFPSVEGMCYHLDISEKRFRKYKEVLVAHGIIEVKREKKGNCLSRNIYFVRDNLRAGSFGSVQNGRVDTEDLNASKSGASNFGRVQSRPVQNDRTKNTSGTNPVKENHRNKQSQSNAWLCTQVCDLLNRRRSYLSSKGRLKPSDYGQSVIRRLLADGVTAEAILKRAKELSVSGTIEQCDWYRFPDYFSKK